ncbi:Quinone oxidoreductase 1 [Candidatus Providencia siddallii]|uniref:NADPH:quinone reductase n=1 Tax=Candidatus Providencia siddallii TaxID=1715285 RepID=A0A0M6W8L6_9GAMM|nr:Quinone oxidoreductase 1 [Candidatus Providencia siddallii]
MAIRIEFERYGGPDVLNVVNYFPSNPKKNEIQIENHAIGVNFIDIYVRSGLYPVDCLPSSLGIEAAGIVVKTGSNVINFKPGDRVVYAQSTLGAYSEIHNVSENLVVLLPDCISFIEAASCFLKGLTVYYLFNQTYKIKRNEMFLFYAAAGGVGIIACQWAKYLGAKLIGIVSSEYKASLAKERGAWEVINYKTENIVNRVNELTNGEKVNVVYDSVGQETWLNSLSSLKRKGLMVSFGNSSGPIVNVNLDILNKNGSLYVTRPSINSYITNREELNKASKILFNMILNGIFDIKARKSQILPLKDAQKIHTIIELRKNYGSSLLIT